MVLASLLCNMGCILHTREKLNATSTKVDQHSLGQSPWPRINLVQYTTANQIRCVGVHSLYVTTELVMQHVAICTAPFVDGHLNTELLILLVTKPCTNTGKVGKLSCIHLIVIFLGVLREHCMDWKCFTCCIRPTHKCAGHDCLVDSSPSSRNSQHGYRVGRPASHPSVAPICREFGFVHIDNPPVLFFGVSDSTVAVIITKSELETEDLPQIIPLVKIF
jgi:hypothetical protein